MVRTGLSEVIGSWKIIARRSPRIASRWLSLAARMSVPSTTMEPDATRPTLGASSPITERAVRLLPQPDSPTRARVSPPDTENDTSRTASYQVPPTRIWVVSPSTLSMSVGVIEGVFMGPPAGRWRRAGRRRSG